MSRPFGPEKFPVDFVLAFLLRTCVILLLIADTEDGFDATVRFADAVAAAHVPVELEGRLSAAASAKTARVPQTEEHRLKRHNELQFAAKHYQPPSGGLMLLNAKKGLGETIKKSR